MSFLFFGKKTREDEEVTVVLDIGSASVAASLVLFRKNQLPKIVYSSRIPITIPEKVDEHDFTKIMLGFVRKTLERVTTEGIKHFNFRKLRKRDIQRVVCVYASPWFSSETKNIQLNEKSPIRINEDYIRDIIQKEKDSFTQSLGISDEVSVIEQKIISTKLNGYATSNPYGKEAHNIEMNFFLGVVPTKIISEVEKVINSYLHPDEIVHNSFSLVAYRTITNLFPNDSNSVIFDVTGEVTDISVIENDVMVNTGSVPYGRNSLVRKIASARQVTNDIALSLLHLYAEGRAEPKLAGEIEVAISGVLASWKEELKSVVPEFGDKTIFLTADSDISGVLKNNLAGEKTHKLIVLSEKHFEKAVLTEKNIPDDIFISTAVMFLDNLYQEL